MANDKKAQKTAEAFDPEFFFMPDGHIRDRIILHETVDIPREGQFVQLNGFGFQCKPGVPIDLPRPVRKMLDTLITTDIIQEKDGTEYKKNRPRFPYTLLIKDVKTGTEAVLNRPQSPDQNWED